MIYANTLANFVQQQQQNKTIEKSGRFKQVRTQQQQNNSEALSLAQI